MPRPDEIQNVWETKKILCGGCGKEISVTGNTKTIDVDGMYWEEVVFVPTKSRSYYIDKFSGLDVYCNEQCFQFKNNDRTRLYLKNIIWNFNRDIERENYRGPEDEIVNINTENADLLYEINRLRRELYLAQVRWIEKIIFCGTYKGNDNAKIQRKKLPETTMVVEESWRGRVGNRDILAPTCQGMGKYLLGKCGQEI